MNYLYVFEGGDFGWAPTAPTEEDLMCVSDGMLEIIELGSVPLGMQGFAGVGAVPLAILSPDGYHTLGGDE
jgi:hypothetical protein